MIYIAPSEFYLLNSQRVDVSVRRADWWTRLRRTRGV